MRLLNENRQSGKLISAIRAGAAGESVWTRDELRRVTGALSTPRLNSDVEVPLTQRESEVLRQLAFGLTNKEIAAALNISYETVKEHVQHICVKLVYLTELKRPSGRFAKASSSMRLFLDLLHFRELAFSRIVLSLIVVCSSLIVVCFSLTPTNCNAAHVVLVKIYVDEEEATTEQAWKSRLSRRVTEASRIISKFSGVKFAVVGFGRWSSDNRIQDLSRSLREF